MIRDKRAKKKVSNSVLSSSDNSGLPTFIISTLSLFNSPYLLFVFTDYILQTGNLISGSDKFFISLYPEPDT